jgi:hypothetical protein
LSVSCPFWAGFARSRSHRVCNVPTFEYYLDRAMRQQSKNRCPWDHSSLIGHVVLARSGG